MEISRNMSSSDFDVDAILKDPSYQKALEKIRKEREESFRTFTATNKNTFDDNINMMHNYYDEEDEEINNNKNNTKKNIGKRKKRKNSETEKPKRKNKKKKAE